jgi:hypothetical protein
MSGSTAHTECVVFPLQQWLRECATVSRYTYIACLVIITFVQGVFSYMPERNNISLVYIVAVYGTDNALFL